MKLKQLSAVMCAGFLATTGFAACGKGTDPNIDPTKTQLYVNTYDGGVGYNWLEALARDFEKEYENYHFADGKTGVQVHTDATRNNTSSQLMANMKSSEYSISIAEEFYYVHCMANDLLYNLDEIVDKPLSDGSGTIKSKMYDEQKEYFTEYDGSYYELPWTTMINGVTYDAGLFEEKGFWFADVDGVKPFANSTYTGKAYTGRGFVFGDNQKKSCGPDGAYNTLDDGLPSSYEEFFYLLDYMVGRKETDPMIYTGASTHYLSYMWESLLMSWAGKEEMSTHFTFDSNGKTVPVVTNWAEDATEPTIENVVITKDNGYMIKQHEAFYYTLKFLKHLYGNDSYFYAGSHSKSFTNLAAQTIFIESRFNPDYNAIGMLIEGGYWYNEATSALLQSEIYGAKAKNRDFRMMVLPGVELGTVNEGEGKPTAASTSMEYRLLVNNNIKGDAEKEEVVEKFLLFAYEDEQLRQTTALSGLPMSMKYEMGQDTYDSMDNYKQSLWDVYDAAKDGGNYLEPVGGNKIYLNNPVQFAFSTQTDFFASVIGGLKETKLRDVFKSGKSVRDYLLGMAISETTWNSVYNK